MMEAIHSSETSVLTRATRRNIPNAVFFVFVLIGKYKGKRKQERPGVDRRTVLIQIPKNKIYECGPD
jgi:hypothetical protein